MNNETSNEKILTPAEKSAITRAKNKASALRDAESNANPSLDVPEAATGVVEAVKPIEKPPANGLDPVSLFKPPPVNEKSRETQLLDVISGIMSTDNMNVKTVFEDKHIVAITRGHIFAERYNSATMRALIQVVSEVRVSKGGLGRKNLVKAITAVISSSEDDVEGGEKRRSRLFGGGQK